MAHITAVPAYGRDYKSKKAVLEDWEAGKDFLDVQTGRYFSKRDAESLCAEGMREVNFRFKRLASVAVVPICGQKVRR